MVTLRIEVDTRALRRIEGGIDRLMNRRAMESYGDAIRRNTRDRMRAERDVDGQAFAPLSESYAKTKRGPGILRETTELYRTIFVEAQNGAANVGTMLPRGTWHQDGVPQNNLPARTWLGVTDDDEADIEERAYQIWEGYFA